ncbi:hypothetical protein C3941_10890 [Kaistia algarum]|nr:hypothetical protein C3941_10890 [Kaistia algarum]
MPWLRDAVVRLLALALLLPSVLGAASTPELVREQALYSVLASSLCAGDPTQKHDGTPTPATGCPYCPTFCAGGCAPPASAAVEIGRFHPVERATFGIVLVAGRIGGTSRSDEGLPRGPPTTS